MVRTALRVLLDVLGRRGRISSTWAPCCFSCYTLASTMLDDWPWRAVYPRGSDGASTVRE